MIRDHLGGALLPVSELGVLVKIVPQGDDLGLGRRSPAVDLRMKPGWGALVGPSSPPGHEPDQQQQAGGGAHGRSLLRIGN